MKAFMTRIIASPVQLRAGWRTYHVPYVTVKSVRAHEHRVVSTAGAAGHSAGGYGCLHAGGVQRQGQRGHGACALLGDHTAVAAGRAHRCDKASVGNLRHIWLD